MCGGDIKGNVCAVDISPHGYILGREVEQFIYMLNRQSFYAEVGRRLYRARRRAGLTQEGLAELVGLSRTSITNIEKGRQKLLLHTLGDLAKVLNVEASALLPRSRPTPASADLVESMLHGASAGQRRMAKAVLKQT